MDFNSYAELAVRLVNTSDAGAGRQDELATVEAYQALMADRAPLCARGRPGLTSMRCGNFGPSSA